MASLPVSPEEASAPPRFWNRAVDGLAARRGLQFSCMQVVRTTQMKFPNSSFQYDDQI
jgi:hypothetical protein